MDFERSMRDHGGSFLERWDIVQLFAVPPSARSQLYGELPPLWERVKCSGTFSVPKPAMLVYYLNAVIGECPGADVVLLLYSLELDS